jgi:hypothetical protein
MLLPGMKFAPTIVMTDPPWLDPELGNNAVTTASSTSYETNNRRDWLTEERETSISKVISPVRPEGVRHRTNLLLTKDAGTLRVSNTHLNAGLSTK